jgi:hypothetical protein
MSGRRLPWPRILLIAEVSLVLLAIALMVPDGGSIGVALLGLPVLVYGWLGARIAERAPENRIGWLLSTAALGGAVSLAGSAYTQFGDVHGSPPLPILEGVRLLSLLQFAVVLVCFLLVLFSYPDGRFPSPRWRPAAVLVAIVGALATLTVLGDPSLQAAGLSPEWLRSLPFWYSMPEITLTIGGVAFLVAVSSLFVRSRRVPTEERRQIRGLLVTLLVMAAARPPLAILIRDDENWLLSILAGTVFILGFLVAVPFSLSVAMLRYGLFSYEVGIRKTIARWVLMVVTVLLSSVVLLLIASVLLGSFLGGRNARNLRPELAVMAGVGVGIVLMLLVRWARRFADRVVFRERETPYQVLSTFSGRVGETYSLDDVLPRLAILLARGTGARVARVWLAVDGDLRPIAT